MGKLVHGIAVVAGFLIYMATKNIIIAAVVAVVLEGIILAILAAVEQHKNAAAAAAAEGRILPKRLWWRITLLVIFAILPVFWLLVLVLGTINEGFQVSGTLKILQMIIIFGIPVVFMFLNIKKTKKWNTEIMKTKGTQTA
jgi:hypothetical protein